MKNILFTGNGKSASWKIRGEQLGNALGATVDPASRNLNGFDRVVMVKRVNHDLMNKAHDSSVPLIYDIVDAWQSRIGTGAGRAQSLQWLRDTIRFLRPSALVVTTNAMALDCAEFGLPILSLPHHARPAQKANPVRDEVKAVGYEGAEAYLGKWLPFLQKECKRRGWKFVINPLNLCDVDIIVAVRDQPGYAARHWKSNVKLANAQATGTPCILNREMGYLESESGGEVWADDEEEMVEAFDKLSSFASRIEKSFTLRSGIITLENVAATYAAWLTGAKAKPCVLSS